MFRSQWQRPTRVWLIALLPVVSACGSAAKANAPKATPTPVRTVTEVRPEPPAPQPTVAVQDPVLTLIESADRAFKAGQAELEQGHFAAAKKEFNRAVNVL